MHPSPFVNPCDRFPLGLPGHVVPISSETPTEADRPWGMDCAVLAVPTRAVGKHGKPTSTKSVNKPTEYTDDSATRRDSVTETVTD